MAGFFGGHGFGFLFRRDEGVVSRSIWWRGTLALLAPLLALTWVWLLIGGGAHTGFDANQAVIARTGLTYLYLLVFAAGILLTAICQYNLSAKRFRARGRLPGLAGVLPLAALLTGAVHWLAPRMDGALPGWAVAGVDGMMLAVAVWNVVDLGVGKESRTGIEKD